MTDNVILGSKTISKAAGLKPSRTRDYLKQTKRLLQLSIAKLAATAVEVAQAEAAVTGRFNHCRDAMLCVSDYNYSFIFMETQSIASLQQNK